jgi:hypothetical protein
MRRPRGARRSVTWTAEATQPLPLVSPADAAAEYGDVLRDRLRYLVPVDQPLVLIAQSGRSGGTLLLRLFDGHPECHVVPYELQQMFRGMAKLGDSSTAWSVLAADKQFSRGRPFALRPALQRAIFEACVAELDTPGPRRLMDCWFTSYFNAWLDNANLRREPKRWVVGFEPRGTTKLAAHSRVYPDGRVLSVVRDPWGWFVSRREKRVKWSNPEVALDAWCAQVRAAIDLRLSEPDRICLIRFSDLIGHTQATMAALAGWLRIDAVPGLLEPSFNSLPSGGRSSFRDLGVTISEVPLARADALTAEERATVTKRAGELYEEALELMVEVEA